MTDGARRLALRREREAHWPSLFHGAFRPFFLCCAIWFPFALLWWVASLTGVVAVTSPLGPIGWHRHELLFGGAGAAIAGYVLTTTPNWSGHLPINGGRLLAMILWWAAARVFNALPPFLGSVVPTVIDTGFLVALTAACGREAWHGKGRGAGHAKEQVALLACLAAACAASHVAASSAFTTSRMATLPAIALLLILISVTAGRLVPSFTRNALPQHQRALVTAQQDRFDAAVHVFTAGALLAWLVDDGMLARALLIAAALVQTIRLAGWGGWRVWNEPSVFSMHVAYVWVPVSLIILALAPPTQQSAALHALTAGAIPAMILAVMARVSITQTGHWPLLRHAPLISVTLVSIGAALRVIMGWHNAAGWAGWLAAAAGLILGFCVFLGSFGVHLLRQRQTMKQQI